MANSSDPMLPQPYTVQRLSKEMRDTYTTSQNQKTIEQDLYHVVAQSLTLPQDQLTWQCEQAIRNYDPCISCATHFLRLHLDREEA